MTESLAANTHQLSPDCSHPGMSIVEGLAEDMVARWRLGERPATEFYLDRLPQIHNNPECALELIAEELALREEFGEPVSLQELDERFPLWPAQIRAIIQCQRTLGRQAALFPSCGELIGDFRLISELGRGSHSRVFLASQPSLDNRLVVLKLSPLVSQEHLSLARLQHSNIVPLYSMHEFQSHGLRGLCQPYFGGAALNDVLERIRQRGHSATASDLFAALHPESSLQGPTQPSTPHWKSLNAMALADVICWIGACLADALQYAHDRGLLHLDIKPSNVLLAADGVPMLLDFHLARPPLRAGEPAPTWIGGSPAYMSPEQLAALEAVRQGIPLAQNLGARADVYALGVVLKEAFAKSDLNRLNGTGSTGLNDILERCTAANPHERYPTAAAVANDLRRHLANLPLSGVPNRSLAERYRKWRRRRPHGLTIGLLTSTVLVGSMGWLFHTNSLAETADRAHRDGMAQLSQGRYLDAIESFRSGETLANGLPLRIQLRSQLRDARLTAERAQAAIELHKFCQQIRPYYAAEFATPNQAQRVERRCRELWEERESLAASLSGQTTPELERLWRADLMDVAILLARLREGSSAIRQDSHQEALLTLDQAESLLGGTGILYLERARHAWALALYPAADAAKTRVQDFPPESAWDHLVLGRYHLANQDVRRALTDMDRSLQRDPQSLWAHYFKGVCCLRLGRPVEAVAEFSACAVTAPGMPWCIHNLGQAYLESQELEPALGCFDRALALDPSLAASLLGRATIHQNKGRYTEALTDLNTAADAGIAAAEVDYRKALVYLASGNRTAAISSLRTCLERDPRHIQAQEKLNRATAGK